MRTIIHAPHPRMLARTLCGRTAYINNGTGSLAVTTLTDTADANCVSCRRILENGGKAE